MNDVQLEHALLDVRDLDRSLAFYRKLMPGWTIRWEGPCMEGSRWAHFGPPDPNGQPGYLSLYETPDAGPAPDDGVRIEHVGFSHPDVNGLAVRLEAEGVAPTDRVDDGQYRRIYFTDPDGHQLEFVQRLR